MSSHKLENYLRTFRKRAALSQEEVAFLLGCRSGAKISRYERFTRTPNLKTALACAVIFAAPVPELFAGLNEEAERETLKRVRRLLQKLAKAAESDPSTARRLQALGQFGPR